MSLRQIETEPARLEADQLPQLCAAADRLRRQVHASGLGLESEAQDLIESVLEAAARTEVPVLGAALGQPFPSFSLEDIDGVPIRRDDLLGHRVLITLERSVDW